jgi:hypothetical protein
MRNSLKARRDRAELLVNSSYPLRRLHRVSEAKERIDAAFAILKDTKDYPAERIRLGSYAYLSLRALADHRAETEDLRHAIQTYEELLPKVLASEPKPETILTDAVGMSHLYTSMARLDRLADRNGIYPGDAAF